MGVRSVTPLPLAHSVGYQQLFQLVESLNPTCPFTDDLFYIQNKRHCTQGNWFAAEIGNKTIENPSRNYFLVNITFIFTTIYLLK